MEAKHNEEKQFLFNSCVFKTQIIALCKQKPSSLTCFKRVQLTSFNFKKNLCPLRKQVLKKIHLFLKNIKVVANNFLIGPFNCVQKWHQINCFVPSFYFKFAFYSKRLHWANKCFFYENQKLEYLAEIKWSCFNYALKMSLYMFICFALY